MNNQGMPVGDFRFGSAYEPCSQELRVRMATLNAVTGTQIRANLARVTREAEIARLKVIDQSVEAQMRAEAHDRIGQSMAWAAQIRKQGYMAKTHFELETLWQQAADFDQCTVELVTLGWLETTATPEPCAKFVSQVLHTGGAQLAAAQKAAREQQKKDSSNPLPPRVLIPHSLPLKAHLRVKADKLDSR